MTVTELSLKLQKQISELTEEFDLPDMVEYNYGSIKFSGGIGVMEQMGRVPMNRMQNEQLVFRLEDFAKL